MLEFMHTMIKVKNLAESMDFYCNTLGMTEVKRMEVEAERCTVVFLAADGDLETAQFDSKFGPNLELYEFWDEEDRLAHSRTPYGHLGYRVDDIYEACQRLMDAGYTVNRPPREGFKAFVSAPDGLTLELIQRRPWLEAAEPWKSMPDTGTWND